MVEVPLYALNLQPYALTRQLQTGTADDLVYRDAKEKGDPTAKKMFKALVHSHSGGRVTAVRTLVNSGI